MRRTLMVAVCILATACAAGDSGQSYDRIDSTTQETYDASVAKLRTPLERERRERFNDALEIVGMSKIAPMDVIAGRDIEAQRREAVHGFTVDDLIERADSVCEADRLRESRSRLCPP